MIKHWIAVASADHVRTGREQGFMQVCHGKSAPLRRVSPGDTVACYSPREQMREGIPYQVTMAPGFHPFRRDVEWRTAAETPIRPLLEHLSWGGPNWGHQLRFELFAVPLADMALIAKAMQADLVLAE